MYGLAGIDGAEDRVLVRSPALKGVQAVFEERPQDFAEPLHLPGLGAGLLEVGEQGQHFVFPVEDGAAGTLLAVEDVLLADAAKSVRIACLVAARELDPQGVGTVQGSTPVELP